MSGEIAANVARIRERIAQAARRAGRPAEEITLVAVTKKQPVAAIQEALAAGIGDLGENYVQEAVGKREALSADQRMSLRWHLLGHLQTNKVKQAGPNFDVIQSVDSLRVAQALSRQAVSEGKPQVVLLQVHLGSEETKFGFAPEEALDAAGQIGALDRLDIQGLMGIAPFGVDSRPYFVTLRRLFEQMPTSQRRTLSMGMTGDFEAAIEEGATMVRIGTAIFGQRH